MGDLILFLVCRYAKDALDEKTRLKIALVNKKFRRLTWTQIDQTVSDNRYSRALIFAWTQAIRQRMQAKIENSRGFNINHSSIACNIWLAKRMPRTCKKYYALAFRLFLITRRSDFRVYLPRTCDRSCHKEELCPVCGVPINDALDCITRFAAHLERNGYRWSVHVNRDLFEQCKEKVHIVQVKTPPKPKDEDYYCFSREEEMELEYFRA